MGVPLRYTLEWQDDKNTAFNTAFSPDGTFDQLIIVVDVNTGEIISKEVIKDNNMMLIMEFLKSIFSDRWIE